MSESVTRNVKMKRRELLTGALATIATATLGASEAAAEKFPISRADIKKVPSKFRKKTVLFQGDYPAGTIVVDTRNKFLYLVQPGGRAIRYGIGVGRQGFSWSGAAVIKRKAKWPTWTPPAAMVARDEFAAQWANGMPGGPKNPLGARALYLYQGNVDTLYRIHGTFVPSSIGKAVSSGCIRMINADVADLYDRVQTGTRVVVLQGRSPLVAEEQTPRKRRRLLSIFD
jgi:lipoprotein-anchoring transpeptidase ErfK/SrfK